MEKKKRRKNPVNDTIFTYHIILSKGLGKLTRTAEKNIIILAEEAIRKLYFKFNSYDDIQDANQTAYYNMLVKWQGFNPSVASSAFTYFTEIHKRSASEFVNSWSKLRGITKEDERDIRRISINSSNQGNGLYNF